MKRLKKVLALLLAASLTVSIMNLTVLAVEETQEGTSVYNQYGMEEQTHTLECETLICGEEEAHTHSEACYMEVTLTCPYQEGEQVVVYDTDGNEVVLEDEHQHGEGCYRSTLTTALQCGKEETQGHSTSSNQQTAENVGQVTMGEPSGDFVDESSGDPAGSSDDDLADGTSEGSDENSTDDSTGEPEVILGEIKVKVECVNPEGYVAPGSAHVKDSYGNSDLQAGTYEIIGDAENGYQLVLNTKRYIGHRDTEPYGPADPGTQLYPFNSYASDKHIALDGDEIIVPLVKGADGKYTVEGGLVTIRAICVADIKNHVTITVYCDSEGPSYGQRHSLVLGDQYDLVQIFSNYGDGGYNVYQNIHRVGDDISCTLTLTAKQQEYIAKYCYNGLTAIPGWDYLDAYGTHTLAENQPGPLSVTFHWDMDESKWVVDENANRLDIHVKCGYVAPVARIVETGAEYPTLQGAINAAQPGQTILLLEDINDQNENGDTCQYRISKSITLDGNGKKITANFTGKQKYVITVSAAQAEDCVVLKNLTIDGSRKSNAGINAVGAKDLTVEDVKVSNSTLWGGYSLIVNNSTVTVKGENTDLANGINGDKGTTSLTVEAGATGRIYFQGTASVTHTVRISGGTISSLSMPSKSTNDVAISGGKIGSLSATVNSNSKVAVSGGAFQNKVKLEHCAEGYLPVQQDAEEGYPYGVTDESVTITPDQEQLSGGGVVTLTVTPARLTVPVAVTCDDGTVELTDNGDGRTWTTSALPNATANYTFTFTVAPDAEGGVAIATCTAAVTANSTPVTPDPVYYYTLTIRYEDAEGNTVADTYTRDLREGRSYSVTSPEVEGYTTEQTVVAGTLTGDLTVTVVYTADENVEDPDTPLVESPDVTETLEPSEPKEPVEEPDEDLEDEETPLAETPDVEPDETEDLDEEDVPLAQVPQTGDGLGLWLTLAILSAAGLCLLTLSGKKGKRVV